MAEASLIAVIAGSAGYVAAKIEQAVKDIRQARRDAAAKIQDAKRRVQENGPCSVGCPDLDGRPTAWCRLPHGHAGDHVSEEGTRWRMVDHG